MVIDILSVTGLQVISYMILFLYIRGKNIIYPQRAIKLFCTINYKLNFFYRALIGAVLYMALYKNVRVIFLTIVF